MIEEPLPYHPKHPWIARLGAALAIIFLAFLGLIVTDIQQTGGWNYWRWVTPAIALIALWLSWYLKEQKNPLSPIKLWHEILHWTSLIASVIVISVFVHIGIMGRMEAALAVLALLSQAVFIAGIYIETTFLFIGLILGLFSIGVAFMEEYLYAIAIPVLLAAGAILVWLILHTKKS